MRPSRWRLEQEHQAALDIIGELLGIMADLDRIGRLPRELEGSPGYDCERVRWLVAERVVDPLFSIEEVL